MPVPPQTNASRQERPPSADRSPCARVGLAATGILCGLLGCGSPPGAAPAPGTAAASAAPGPLKVIVSGDTRGWIAPCGCTANQSGGLPRRATFVQAQRQTAAVLLLDAGGAAGGASTYDRLRFDAILAGELAMGVAAHNLGAAELLLGPAWLREAAQRRQAPFVSANTTDAEGRPLAPGSRLCESAGAPPCRVIGVVSPTYATAEIRVGDPAEAVLRELRSAAGERTPTVVLAWLPEAELRALAAQLPEVDVIVGGPTGQAIAPEPVGGRWLAAAANKGKFLVEMTLAERRWSGRVVEMSPDLADDAEQLQNIAAFRAELAERDLPAHASGFVSAAARQAPAEFRVAGSDRCAACHADEQRVWQESAHGRAWRTLQQPGAQADAACQVCHTTGFGAPGGFVSAKTSLDRVNVGCESCHGPAESHVRDSSVRTPFRAAEQCVVCHDAENSPRFEFAPYWDRIRHGAAVQREAAP